ncbi:MAG: hypothetical protein WCJ39_09185 [bacterium]
MLEAIKTAIFKTYKQEDLKGLFFSLFDANKNLLVSNGVITTDKPLGQLIDILYNAIVTKHPETQSIVVDIVTETTLQNDVATLLGLLPTENGLVILDKDDKKSGVILPGTAGITDMKTAITKTKEKFGLSGEVEMYTFKTEKISISK